MGSIRCDVCLVEGSLVSESPLLPTLFQKHLGIMVLDQLLSCDNCSQLVHLWDEFSQQAKINIFVSHPNARHQCNVQASIPVDEAQSNDRPDEFQASLQIFTPQDTSEFQCTVSCADTVSAAAMWSELQAKEEEERSEDHLSMLENAEPISMEHINCEINGDQQIKSVNRNHNEKINDGAFELKFEDLTKKLTKSEQDVSSAPFSCTDCEKKFFYEKSLSLHIKTMHTENISNTHNISQTGLSKLSCPICYGCLSTEFQMNQHIRLCHPNSETVITNRKANPNYLIQSEFVCEYCNLDLTSQQKLEQHIKLHDGSESKDTNISIIGKSTGDVKINNKSGSKTCFQCNKTFSCRSSLLSHNMNFHTKYLSNGNHLYTCKLCNKGFDRKLSLVTHLRFHPEMKNKNNSSSYNKASDTSLNSRSIKFIASNRTENKKYTERDSLYICKICLKSNPSEFAMQSHIKKFHGAVPSSSNLEPDDLATIISQQSGKRKQKPLQNKASFPLKNKNKPAKPLTASLRDFTKTGPGKYKCNICNKTFNSSNGIDYHLHKHILGKEGIKIDTQHYSKKDSCYVCNICDKTLATAAGIQYHIRHSHLKL